MSSRLCRMFSVCRCTCSCAPTSCASGAWIFTHQPTCACVTTWPSWQLGQLTALAGHVCLICSFTTSALSVTLFHHSGKLLRFTLIPSLLWESFFETATLASLEAFEPVSQQHPQFSLYLFSRVILILHWLTWRKFWQTQTKVVENNFMGLSHMVYL